MADWQNSNDVDASAAKLEAQKLAWAPFAFQAARIMRNSGMLAEAEECREQGATLEQLEEATGDFFVQDGNPDTDNRKNVHYAVYVLADAGVSMGIFDEVVRDGVTHYVLTLTGYFILRDRITTVNMDFTHDVCYEGLFYLEDALRTAKPTGLHKAFGQWETVYAALAELPDHVRRSWFAFDHYFSDSSFPKALPIVFADKPKTLLDIGGNTGKWAIKCAKYNPDVTVTIADLPGQLRDAKENILANDLADRVKYAPVNLLDHSAKFPTGFDAVWMSQFLDCFGPSDIMSIVSRAKDALNDDGTMYIMETFVDLQRYEISKYCLDMTSLYFTAIANGKSRMYHSKDMIELVELCGMEVTECVERVGLSHSILKCKKRK
jgi:hypothetical protein